MDKYLKRRWAHAQEYTAQQVVQLDNGSFWSVQSTRGGWYTVYVQFDAEGKLSRTHCPCDDHGETKLHGVDF
ncbi:MAG: hypothetical protein GWN58_27575 [Anaerolineae bacterium]|nr:hypothetical protein [Anaerolineae bacterium]